MPSMNTEDAELVALAAFDEVYQREAQLTLPTDGWHRNKRLVAIRAALTASGITRVEEENVRLREGWQNAVFALEYWGREAVVCGHGAKWIEGPLERTHDELKRHRAALAQDR